MKKISTYIIVILLFGCDLSQDNLYRDKIGEIDENLEKISKENGYSGAVLIAKNEEVLFKKAYGYANLAHNVPNRIDTKFGIASMGKMFTAVAIMQLVQQDKLNLDSTVGETLPDYPNTTVRDSVTIEQLLVHTSGLTDFFNNKFEHRAKHSVRTIADYFSLFRDDELLFSPGTGFSYSNAGYIVLGMIIERLSGDTYYEYVNKNIFEVAGMKNTGNYETDRSIPNIAEGYIKKDEHGIWTTSTYMKGAKGSSAGGAYSTVEDLLKFAIALKNNKLISKESLAQMISNDVHDAYGYGFTLNKFNGIEVYGHNGGAHGVSGELDIYRSTDLVVATLSNRGPLDGWVDVRSMIREKLAGSTSETNKYIGTKELIEIYESQGFDAAIAKLDSMEGNISDKYIMDAANKYRESKEFDKAIDLLEILATAIPDSWYIFSILADTYLDSGDKVLAIENYHKSLKLDSNNQWAIEKLDTLE
ncbi:CubicO group peptidase, beta-lactamase class C family [Marivirga sericea]|uniref:CubicO group peptidase, beta-lactamase class C family n=1 Tax=Marivirga sericea TaxID=1028 RepID=A0A1X7K4J6_9BACT|nr:serine hydrolase domain-containing protein [Marivirga sericea]SMG35836.1 CubicO group peptidase, beta-lactamase class C family [Marivirga sericea]